MKKAFTIIAIILGAILTCGLAIHFFLPDELNPFKPDDKPSVSEVQYNPTFGTNFKETHPISALPLKDSMPVAPYAYADTTLFSGKRITKIDAPVATVKAVDENQYFTLYVIKSSTVKAGGIFTGADYKEYKVYLPKEELTSTTVDKWITIDLKEQFIYVGEDETLAFMKSNDPVICRYASGKLNDFYYDLAKSGKLQANQSIYYGIYTDDVVNLKGKTISILGDSISTFSGISNNATDANSTIGNNAVFYPKGEIDNSAETWWVQTADATGMSILVNNSWSGSRVLSGSGAAYNTRCVELHDDTGANSGTYPDVIAVYIGINDFNANATIGSFKELSEIYTEKEGYILPESVAQAYAVMVHKMMQKYDKSEIFLFTLPANGTNKDTALLNQYNKQIINIAEYFDCHVVDIGNIEGYEYAKYTGDGLHPNEAGMDLITDLFVRTLGGVYAKKDSK